MMNIRGKSRLLSIEFAKFVAGQLDLAPLAEIQKTHPVKKSASRDTFNGCSKWKEQMKERFLVERT